MRILRSVRILRCALFATVIALAMLRAPVPTHGLQDTEWHILRVTTQSPEDVARLTSGAWDVLEARQGDDLFVLGNSTVMAELRAAGFDVSIHEVIAAPNAPFTYYGGYRTVAEHEAHLDAIVAAHPDLAVLVDFGDSWRKTQGRAGGHDLKALCLTRLRLGDCALDPDTDKPRFFVLAAVHARELSPAEVAWRWIDHLINGYGADPDLTVLLDTTEIWVVPVGNPDGRTIVEQGGSSPIMQRKNANDSAGGCSIPNIGIDLNRNASWQWGVAGSSSAPCSELYHGAGPTSEPENQAIEGLMRALFHDQRGPALSDVAPITTSGLMVTVHSFGNLIILPWSWSTQPAANDAGLRAIAFRMGYYTGYTSGTGAQVLYPMSGNHDDWAYGVLGIPGFTIEIGSGSGACGSFLPAYSCVDSTFWAPNRNALLYAAKIARQPYALAPGPAIISAALNMTRTLAGSPVTLTATFDDNVLGAGTGKPAAQAISAAEFYVDVPPWAGGAPVAMSALDGGFNATRETAISRVETGLSPGRHTLYVRGRDAQGNWGPTTAAWLWVGPDTRGLLTGVVSSDNACADSVAPLAGATLTAARAGGPSLVTQSGAGGRYQVSLDAGTYTVTVSSPQHLPATATAVVSTGLTTTLDFTLPRRQACVQLSSSSVVATALPGQTAQVVVSVTNGGATPVSLHYFRSLGDFGSIEGFSRSAPDAFGYTYEALGGMDQIDSSGGVALSLVDDDEANVSLPFAIPLYGITTTLLRVGDNGGALLGVTTGDVWVANLPLSATTNVPNHFIAPFWDDLYPAGSVRWLAIGSAPNRKVVIDWRERAHFKVQTGAVTVQAVLAENGNLLFQYPDVDLGDVAYSFGASATIGIRGANPAQSLTFSHNSSSLRNGLSICFRRPGQPPCWADDVAWLDVSQPVTLGAGETRALTLTLTAPLNGALPVYHATVLLDSPDLPSLVTLPVTLVNVPLPFQSLLPLVTHP